MSSSAPPPAGAPAPAPNQLVTLHQYFPAYELQAYMRICELPHEVVNSRFLSYGSTGDLPQVQHGSALVGARRCLGYLRALRQPRGEEIFNETQIADAAAWMGVVHNTLNDVLLFGMVEAGMLRANARGWSASSLVDRLGSPFDSSTSPEARARTFLAARGFDDARWVRRVAAQAYLSLAERYRNRGHEGRYFFGHEPTSLDAVVFGHLASARGVPLCSLWAKEDALPVLGPLFAAFASQFFADDAILGAKPFSSLTWAAAETLTGAVGAVPVGAGTSHANAAAVTACRGEKGVVNTFRQREQQWLDTLQALHEGGGQPGAAGDAEPAVPAASAAARRMFEGPDGTGGEGVAAEPASAARASAAAAGGVPLSATASDFPLGFGERPGMLRLQRRGPFGWYYSPPPAPAAGGQETLSHSPAVNALATFGILGVAAAVVVLALRRQRH